MSDRKQRGRPKKKEDNHSENFVGVRLSNVEKARLRELKYEYKMSESSLIRFLVNDFYDNTFIKGRPNYDETYNNYDDFDGYEGGYEDEYEENDDEYEEYSDDGFD